MMQNFHNFFFHYENVEADNSWNEIHIIILHLKMLLSIYDYEVYDSGAREHDTWLQLNILLFIFV